MALVQELSFDGEPPSGADLIAFFLAAETFIRVEGRYQFTARFAGGHARQYQNMRLIVQNLRRQRSDKPWTLVTLELSAAEYEDVIQLTAYGRINGPLFPVPLTNPELYDSEQAVGPVQRATSSIIQAPPNDMLCWLDEPQMTGYDVRFMDVTAGTRWSNSSFNIAAEGMEGLRLSSITLDPYQKQSWSPTSSSEYVWKSAMNATRGDPAAAKKLMEEHALETPFAAAGEWITPLPPASPERRRRREEMIRLRYEQERLQEQQEAQEAQELLEAMPPDTATERTVQATRFQNIIREPQ